MVTQQEENRKKKRKWTLQMFFLKNHPEFWTFQTSSRIPTLHHFFWPELMYWDINFVLKCLPAQCAWRVKIQATSPFQRLSVLKAMLLMTEQNLTSLVDVGTKQKPCCWCRDNTKAVLLILEQNEVHVVDAKIYVYLLKHEKTIQLNV